MCTIGDTILLGKGKYPIKPCTELPKRSMIIGISDMEDIILYPKGLDALSSLFDIAETEVLNVTIIKCYVLQFFFTILYLQYFIIIVLFLSTFLAFNRLR